MTDSPKRSDHFTVRPIDDVRILYVAGPYRADTEHGVLRNIQRAEQLAAELWRLGYVVLCPHKNSAHFGGLIADDSWLSRDLELLARCDGIVMGYGWERSRGSVEEERFARSMGLHVFYNLGELTGPRRPSQLVAPSDSDRLQFGWGTLFPKADPEGESGGNTPPDGPVSGPSR